MHLSFLSYLTELSRSPTLTLVTLLTLAVVLVNGWTDAPNAIAGAVVTGALSFRRAVLLAALCNFLGVLCVTSVNASVAETVYSIASFHGGQKAALTALCAAMCAIVLWAAGAWYFGIPTSEGHALVAGISGAAIALERNFSCIHFEQWGKVLIGLALSTLAGCFAGRKSQQMFAKIHASPHFFRLLQLPGAAGAAFLHGAQDGQKFLGVFLLGAALAQGRADEQTFVIPLWLMVFCAAGMALGTLMGGRRIIDKVGRDMISIGPREGAAADIASSVCLLSATLLGLPVSTTHTKTAALLGVGQASGKPVDRSVVGQIALAWLLTFPGCTALGYWCAKLFLALL